MSDLDNLIVNAKRRKIVTVKPDGRLVLHWDNAINQGLEPKFIARIEKALKERASAPV